MEYAIDNKTKRVIIHIGGESPEERLRVYSEIISNDRIEPGMSYLLSLGTEFHPVDLQYQNNLLQWAIKVKAGRIAHLVRDKVTSEIIRAGTALGESMGISVKVFTNLQEMIDWIGSEEDKCQ